MGSHAIVKGIVLMTISMAHVKLDLSASASLQLKKCTILTQVCQNLNTPMAVCRLKKRVSCKYVLASSFIDEFQLPENILFFTVQGLPCSSLSTQINTMLSSIWQLQQIAISNVWNTQYYSWSQFRVWFQWTCSLFGIISFCHSQCDHSICYGCLCLFTVSFWFFKSLSAKLNNFLMLLIYSYKKKEDKRQVSIIKAPCVPYLGGNSTIKDMVDHSQSSGSGSGLPLLVRNWHQM